MRALLSKRLGLAVLAGLGLSALAANNADAALLTLDLRVQGGGKSTTVSAAGGTVTLDVYAQVKNTDSNGTNDGFQQSQFSVLSADGIPAALGDLASVTFNTPFIDTAVSNVGLAQNLDANATDLEVGGTDGNSPTGWIVANTGTASKAGTGSASGATEFFLGTTTWTLDVPGIENSTTSLNIGLRQSTSNLATGRTFKFTSDGTVYDLRGDGRNGAGTIVTDGGSAAIVAGAPVSITVVPEPASLGLLGLAGVGLLARRRRA